jgi:uncharacterized membrane protein YheB (UPF0754 family)
LNPLLVSLLAKALSGAYVGYITNDLAIQMLFRKRFGLGGIVLRTRAEFVANISQLVERDIINHHTLERELAANPEPLDAALADWLGQLLEHHLPQALPPDFALADLPGWAESVEGLLDGLRPALAQLGQNLLPHLASQLPLATLLPPEQQQATLGRLLPLAAQALTEAQTPEALAQALWTHHADQTLRTLLPPELQTALRQALEQELAQAPAHLRTHLAPALAAALAQARQALGVDEWLAQLAQQLAQKPLQEILGGGDQPLTQLTAEIAQRLRHIVNSPEGRQLVGTFGEFVLEVLAQERTTIFELMTDDLADNFAGFLRAKLPGILQTIIVWVEEREHQLEVIIDGTFRQNIKSKFQEVIYQLFVGSVSQYAKVVDRLTHILESHRQDPEQTAAALTEEVIGFLQSNTIGQIIQNLRQNPALGQELDLGGLLLSNLDKALANPNWGFFNPATLLARRLGELASEPELRTFLDKALHSVIEKELKEKFLFSPKLSHWATQQLAHHWDAWLDRPLRAWLPTGAAPNEPPPALLNLARQLPAWLASPQAQQTAAHWLGSFTQGKTVAQAAEALVRLDEAAPQLGEVVAQVGTGALRIAAQNLAQAPLAPKLAPVAQAGRGLAKPLRQALLGQLPQLLTGRIAEVVQASLDKMPADKLLDLVEKFMGKELKPITLLGALLGALAGVALAVIPSAGGSWTDTTLAALAYGITGYGTNWLALRMIFRPYKKKYLLGAPLPFTPGVVAQNQARFATNMGKFVAGGLLNPQNLKNAFAQRRDQLKKWLADLLGGQTATWLAPKQTQVSQALAQAVVSQLTQQPGLVASALAQATGQAQTQAMSPGLAQTWQTELQQLLRGEAFREKSLALAQDFLINFAQSNRPLAQYADVEKLAPALTAALAGWLHNQEPGQWLPAPGSALPADWWGQRLFAKAAGRRLNQFLNPDQQAQLKGKLGGTLRKRLLDQELRELVFGFIDTRLAEELAPAKPINELFGGSVTRLLRQNMDTVVENLLGFGLEWLRENKEMLADKVYQKAKEQSRVGTFFYQSAIRNTVHELADEGIPEFFRREAKSLKTLIASEVEKLGESHLADLHLDIDEGYLKSLVDTFLHRPEIHEAVERLLFLLLDELFKLPVSAFIGIAGVQSAADVLRIFGPELAALQAQLASQWPQKADQLAPVANGLLVEWAKARLAEISPAGGLGQVPPAAWAALLRPTLRQVLAAPAYAPAREGWVAQLLAQTTARPLGEWLPLATLAQNAAQGWNEWLAQPTNQDWLQTQLAHGVGLALLPPSGPALPERLAPATRQFLAETLATATLASVEQHLDPLIGAVDLRKIVVTEITEMNPAEIEALFNSFAARYFTQLINYGFGFGVAFGLVIDFGLAWGLAWLTGKLDG